MQATLSIYKASTFHTPLRWLPLPLRDDSKRFLPIPLFWLTSALKDEACMVEAIVFWNEPTKLSYWNFQLRKG